MTYGFDDHAEAFQGLEDWTEFQQLYADRDTVVRDVLRAAIYCRRSLKDVVDKSIGRQLMECTAHCRAQGFAYDTDNLLFIDVDRSGASMDGREGLHAALDAARRGEFDVLVFEQVDRLTRDVLDAHRIRKEFEPRGIVMHAAGIGEIKLVQLTLRAFHAERERNRIVALSFSRQRETAVAEAFRGRRRIFGYVCLPAERSWGIDEREAPILREIYRWIDEEDLSLSAVCRRLTAMGAVPATGSRWHVAKLYCRGGWGLLQNTLIKGVWRWAINRPQPIEFALPRLAIVEPALFDRVNARLAARETDFAPRTRTKIGLVTGNLRCGACGGPMADTPGKCRERRIHCYAALDGRCTERKSLNSSAIERHVLLTIRDDILREDRLDDWNVRRLRDWQALDDGLAPAREELKAELRSIDDRLDALGRTRDDLPPILRLARADDELAHHRLAGALAELVLPAPLSLAAPEAATLREGITALLLRLPIVSKTEDDRRLVARLRMLVTRVILKRESGGGGYHVRCLPGIVEGREPGSGEPDAGRWLEGRMPKPGYAALKSPERIIRWHEAAANGAYALSDRDWGLVAHLFEPLKFTHLDPRVFAEALVMLAATGMPHSLLPERYAFATKRVYLVRRLGFWPHVIRILKRHRSPRVEGLDPNRFDPRPRAPRKTDAPRP